MTNLIVHDMPSRNGQVAKFWLVVTIDKDGNESPCGVNRGGGWIMLGTSRADLLPVIREQAKMIGENAPEGVRIVLREYHDFTDLEEFH